MTKKKIAVLGGGSWGSVLSNLASLNGSEVVLWMRDKKVAKFINEKKENRKYLPGYKLDKSLIASSDLSVINSANLVLFCIPSDAFREVFLKSRDFISSEAHLVSATKGVEEEGFCLMSDILETNSQEGQNIGVISGPNLAKEISLGQLTGTVIASKNKTQEVYKILDKLEQQNRDEQYSHRKVYRPWGWYDSIESGENFQVKRLHINPKSKLSLQEHRHRAEHWVVVRGTATAINGKEVLTLNKGESTYIPLGVKHSLENKTKNPLEIIEVQSGTYLGEDDIIRFEDIYGRE